MGRPHQPPEEDDDPEDGDESATTQADVGEQQDRRRAGREATEEQPGLELPIPTPGAVDERPDRRIQGRIEQPRAEQHPGDPPHGGVGQVEHLGQIDDEIEADQGVDRIPPEGPHPIRPLVATKVRRHGCAQVGRGLSAHGAQITGQ